MSLLLVDCPYCDKDVVGHVSSDKCSHCRGTRKTPSSVAKILRQLRVSRIRFLGSGGRKFVK